MRSETRDNRKEGGNNREPSHLDSSFSLNLKTFLDQPVKRKEGTKRERAPPPKVRNKTKKKKKRKEKKREEKRRYRIP
jgi:hypothetical protein